MRGLGTRHYSVVYDSPSYLPRDNYTLVSYWRACEACESLSGVYKFELVRCILQIFHYGSEYLPWPSASEYIPTLGEMFIDIPQGRVEYLFYYIG